MRLTKCMKIRNVLKKFFRTYSDCELVRQQRCNKATGEPHYIKSKSEQSHLGAAYFWSRDPQSSPELVNSTYPGTAKGDMLPSFVKSILDGTEPEVSAQEVVDVMSVSLAIEESLQSQQPVNVNYQSIYN